MQIDKIEWNNSVTVLWSRIDDELFEDSDNDGGEIEVRDVFPPYILIQNADW